MGEGKLGPTKRCASPPFGSAAGANWSSDLPNRPSAGGKPVSPCEDSLPVGACAAGGSAAPTASSPLVPDNLLHALKMISQKHHLAANVGGHSPSLSPRTAPREGVPGKPRGREWEDRGHSGEDGSASTGPHGLAALQRGSSGIQALFASNAASGVPRRSPRGAAWLSSPDPGPWLDDLMAPFLCDSRVRRFILQTKTLAEQNEPEKLGALFERALQAYHVTSAPAVSSDLSAGLDLSSPPCAAAATPSTFASSLPCPAVSPVTAAPSLSAFPGISGDTGERVSSPAYLRRPLDTVPNPKRSGAASSLAEQGKRGGSPDSLPTLASSKETGVSGPMGLTSGGDPAGVSSRGLSRGDGDAEALSRSSQCAGAGSAVPAEEGVSVLDPEGKRRRGTSTQDEGCPREREQTFPGETEREALPTRETRELGSSGESSDAFPDNEERPRASQEVEENAFQAKRTKDQTARTVLDDRDGKGDVEGPPLRDEAASDGRRAQHEENETKDGDGDMAGTATSATRSKRKCSASGVKEAEAPPAKERASETPESDAPLSLLDHIIHQHKIRSVKPAPKVTGEALEALQRVFSRHPDGISDPNVFADEIVVPLLGLGEYMSGRLFRMVDSHETGTVSLPMMKEFWANRLVLASEDATTVDEGFPSSKLPVYLMPTCASPQSDEEGSAPSACLNDEVVPHVVKRGSARNFFNVVKSAGADSISADDLRPWVEEVLRQAPDMAFLNEPSASEFAARYVDSVITRIMFEVDTEDAGNISLKALKHSCLPHVWYTIRPGVELSVVRRFFSYEHFYVFYCTFHALDEDEDFLLDRSDVRRHDTHNMNIEVEERLFLQVARTFRSPKAGYMCFEDWIWFLLVYYDVTSERAIQFWFKIFDIDGDGVLRDHEIEVFFNAQVDRFRMRDDKLPTYRDFICPMCDALCVPYSSGLRCRDLLRDPVCGGCFINCLLKRAAFQAMDDGETISNIVRGSPWDRQLIELTPFEVFANQQYQELTARKGEECFIEESSSFLDESVSLEK
ncbi:hypothetical protein NCLIV_038240 [Neospora caninum Liverpool]|uniref:EF-hand domain-containing protein n=1 Tax=Neospora caninum (strain Liverpool) TaxID=572307 RepID=F0VJY1_NEOCL|nr:hypothetical protein NCLIV_038240 [Neospora caninum Liverpool]CBZ54043.1 hypothetical protein NCLIV_038240 [Neospora caninum Liverpool]|eukprot:XP_003884074.1 hypothetical protein NCLIV_038240 [Neospora caninum Liverpool]